MSSKLFFKNIEILIRFHGYSYPSHVHPSWACVESIPRIAGQYSTICCISLGILYMRCWSVLAGPASGFLVHILWHHQILHVLTDLLLLRRIGVPPHRPDRTFEEVIHGLDTSTLEFRKAEKHKDSSTVGKHRIEEESAPAHVGHHARCCFGDAIVNNPVKEETERHRK